MANGAILATNRRARSEFSILDTVEAGIQLTGPEVKSCKQGSIKLAGSYGAISSSGAVVLIGCHISPYKPAAGAQKNYDPDRTRILLLNKRQIATLIGKLKEKRISLVPLSCYLKGGLIKFEMALAQGKKQYEKREAIRKRDIEREIGRRLKR